MSAGELRTAPRAEARDAGEWWREAVIYENHLPSFRDGNGDGIGDLRGLIDGLPYLDQVLGVDAVWVGPCFRSPLLDQGFDITDYREIEPVFGDMPTFDRLVDEAHRREIKIIADYIPNHTSDQHPWFLASRSSRQNPYRDWYVWRDPAPGGGPPNNWIAEVGGSSWEWDEATEQYYLHSHLPEQPDLNWRNPEVREAMLNVLRFWLDRGVDGFRIDVAHMLMKDPELRDNPPSPPGHTNPYELQPDDYLSQRHVNDRAHPDVHGALAEIRSVLDEYGARLAIAEIEALPWEAWAEYYGEAGQGVHLPFAFALIETAWHAPALEETIGSLEGSLPDGAWPILALGNHDRSRLASRLGPAQARVAAMLLLTLRGTPVLLYGDELGMVDQAVPRERQRDYFGLSGGVSHDPARTPFPWTQGPNGGFSVAESDRLWLPISEEYETINVESQLEAPASSLNLYRALLALRRKSPALREGDYSDGGVRAVGECLVYERGAEGDRKAVALNLTSSEARVRLGSGGTVRCSTYLDRHGERMPATIKLRPDEGLVLDVS